MRWGAVNVESLFRRGEALDHFWILRLSTADVCVCERVCVREREGECVCMFVKTPDHSWMVCLSTDDV